jgi:hypothetical protein
MSIETCLLRVREFSSGPLRVNRCWSVAAGPDAGVIVIAGVARMPPEHEVSVRSTVTVTRVVGSS